MRSKGLLKTPVMIILSGVCDIVFRTPESTLKVVHKLMPGSVFGISDLLQLPVSAFAITFFRVTNTMEK